MLLTALRLVMVAPIVWADLTPVYASAMMLLFVALLLLFIQILYGLMHFKKRAWRLAMGIGVLSLLGILSDTTLDPIELSWFAATLLLFFDRKSFSVTSKENK